MKAVKCPVCDGSGRTSKMFDSSTNTKECHGCNGKGWVEIGSDAEPPMWRWPAGYVTYGDTSDGCHVICEKC